MRFSALPRCKVKLGEGGWVEAELRGSSFGAPYLTVLNLRPSGSRLAHHVVILPDTADAGQFRRLRVLPRWKCGKHMKHPG